MAIIAVVFTLLPAFWILHLLRPLRPPNVTGGGLIFINASDSLKERVRIYLDVKVGGWNAAGSPYVVMTLDASGLEEGDRLDWQLILLQSARLSNATTDKGVEERKLQSAENSAQVFSGNFGDPGGKRNRTVIRGSLRNPVSTRNSSKRIVILPQYGRSSEGFPFTDSLLNSEVFDRGFTAPTRFHVAVGGGFIDPTVRLDSISPPLEDPSKLFWEDDESIRVSFLLTALDGENRLQYYLIALSAILGIGCAALLAAVQEWLT
jgi:hypothetical protein